MFVSLKHNISSLRTTASKTMIIVEIDCTIKLLNFWIKAANSGFFVEYLRIDVLTYPTNSAIILVYLKESSILTV